MPRREVLLVTRAVAAHIREGRTHPIPGASGKLGMVALDAALLKLGQDGLVDPDEALAEANDEDGLARSLARHGRAEADRKENRWCR